MTLAKVLGSKEKKEGYLEGNGYRISWCVGHLIGLCDAAEYDQKYAKWRYDDLPIIPDEWKTKILEGTKKQFHVLKSLMNAVDTNEIICATDAGKEGELIFRLVYEKARCRKPVKRLWISSMEEKSIRDGIKNMKDGSCYDDLYQSALCRAKADWIVGINASRLFSVLYNKKIKVGRVQTPTLAMIVDRNQKVKGFVKEKYYEAVLKFGNMKAVSEQFSKREDAEKIAEECRGKTCRLIMNEVKEKTVPAPSLYDLTTLQRDANRILGYTAQETLDAAQELYEDGLITYPRTDSQYLNDEMAATEEELIHIVEALMDFMDFEEYEPDIRKTLNSKKVTDHHAIIPTEKLSSEIINALKEKTRNVLILIETRLLMATSKPYVYESHNCELSCQDIRFYLKYQNVKQKGYKQIEREMFLYFDKNTSKKEQTLEMVELAESYDSCETEVLEKWTQPPKQFTEDTLLAAMERAGNEELDTDVERKGLGTPATRAGIIEKLVQCGYIKREKKQLIPTDDGNVLITIIPEELRSPLMTANWENTLARIAKGNENPADFMNEINQLIENLTARYHGISDDEKKKFAEDRESIGTCPVCRNSIFESSKSYYCSNKECRFALWKNDRFFESQGKKMDTGTAKKLLKNGKVYIKDLHSQRTGKMYAATVHLVVSEDGTAKFNLQFPQR